jgi:ABC-type branched-subunit amino acid transport system substrate-binding protein
MTHPGRLDDAPSVLYRFRGRRGRALLAVLSALLLGLAAFVAVSLFSGGDDDSCGEGVTEIGEGAERQCVGVTDGSFAFGKEDALVEVSGLIKDENERVTKQAEAEGNGGEGTPYVSVVYLLPMESPPGETLSGSSVERQLQGAYTAQVEVNQGRSQGESPQIRLLLGNTGVTEEQWRHTVDQIKERRQRDRIVAVAGLGTSVAETKEMTAALTEADIPAFGSVLTSDTFENTPGLVRVAPPNSDEAAAAVEFLSTDEYAEASVLVIEDANQEDDYTSTLAEEFTERLPSGRLTEDHEPIQFDSSRGALATYFLNQTPNLCLRAPDVVYFAGRGRDLPDLIAPLASRQCSDRPLTVLSGDDVGQVTRQEGFDEMLQSLRNGNIKLIYTGLAHPRAWETAPDAFDKSAIAPFQDGGTYLETFKDGSLDDGQAIMAYDAMVTAVRAIRIAGKGEDLDASDVAQMITSLNDTNAVAGASGRISLLNNGSPDRKAIPILEVEESGEVTTRLVTSASGEPWRRP